MEKWKSVNRGEGSVRVTNLHKFSGLKWHMFIISQFPQDQECGNDLAGSSTQDLTRLQSLCQTECILLWSSGSNSKLSQGVGRIHFLVVTEFRLSAAPVSKQFSAQLCASSRPARKQLCHFRKGQDSL